MFCCFGNHVYATDTSPVPNEPEIVPDVQVYEDIDWSEVGFTDVQVTVRKQNKLIPETNVLFEPSLELDFVIESTQEQIHFERIDDTGFYFSNDELVTTIEFGSINGIGINIPNSIKNLGYPATSGFSNFYYSGYTRWVVKKIAQMAAEDAIGAITSAIIGAYGAYIVQWTQKAAKAASDIYNALKVGDTLKEYDDGLYGADVSYARYNGQCNILAWYGYKAFVLDPDNNSEVDLDKSTAEFIPNQKHTWNSTPYDYTQPSACWLLMSDYPY